MSIWTGQHREKLLLEQSLTVFSMNHWEELKIPIIKFNECYEKTCLFQTSEPLSVDKSVHSFQSCLKKKKLKRLIILKLQQCLQ